MWTPKQYLHPKIVEALFLGGFTPLQIEFLGWLSYNASALNNSRNPCRAAHTLLAKESMVKMLATFTHRKLDSINPVAVEPHGEADKILSDLDWAIKAAITKAQMTATDYEDFTEGGVSDGTPLRTKAASAGGCVDEEKENDE